MADELPIPDAALDDPEAFELLRVWASRGEQFVTIEPHLSGDALHFGTLIADLIGHGALLYSQRDGTDLRSATALIVEELQRELRLRSHEIVGHISHDA